jgi:predicted nucleotidyltransferase
METSKANSDGRLNLPGLESDRLDIPPDSPYYVRQMRRSAWRGAKNEELQLLVRAIIDHCAPLRVVLFGSAARGDMRENSDLDLMIVAAEGTDTKELGKSLYRMMRGVDVSTPVDFVVVTPSVLERHADTLGFVYREALREGYDVYAA